MVHTKNPSYIAALLLLGAIPLALSHSDDDHVDGVTTMGATELSQYGSVTNNTHKLVQSYFAYADHGGLMLGHLGIMIVAWVFILPIGIMLSVSRSRLALIAQLFFLGVNGIGLLLGTIYNSETPDLYENNAHGTIGWIMTCIVLVQCVMGIVKLAAAVAPLQTSFQEQAPFLPVSTEALARHEEIQPYRYSNDSGHFTASDASRSQSISSMTEGSEEGRQPKLREYQDTHTDGEAEPAEEHNLLSGAKIQRLASGITAKLSKRTSRMLDIFYDMIDGTSLLGGFLAITSGAIVYGGVFRGDSIFNGLAHCIKGGIFFWYGLLTLGRWMGCFAKMGWAWNIKPPACIVTPSEARMPSAEFVESFVIFLYGVSNVWLEHLAAWGSAWSSQDFEHVAISIMFFGGGLCGMLVESENIRDFLNTTILMSPAAYKTPDSREKLMPPRSYPFSMNPFPGLIILLLGLMMSSHHQSSVISTTVHKQWGMLFVGFALARAVTYILMYISPPTSYLPSRPPSELISSFCLISGGLIFIASNKDTVGAMEHYGLHAMFPFTVTMGFTAFLMAWVVLVLAVKGWALRRHRMSKFI